jgi:hypothetical protein
LPCSAAQRPARSRTARAARPYGACCGIGDRQTLQATIADRAGQVAQFAVDLQRRAVRCQQRETPDRVELALVTQQAVPGEAKDVRLVGREKEVERRPLRNLAGEVTRGTEGDDDLLAALLLVTGNDLAKCELQIGGGSDSCWLGVGNAGDAGENA